MNKNGKSGVLRDTVLSVAAKLNCAKKTDAETVLCLQKVDANKFMEMAFSDPSYKFTPSEDFLYSQKPFFYTSVEDSFSSGLNVKVPLIAGFNKDEGIIFAAGILNNSTRLDELNLHWDLHGTQLIFKRCCNFSKEDILRSQEVRLVNLETFILFAKYFFIIRNFYFGDQLVSEETAQSLIDMLSDLNIWVGMQRSVDFYSKYSNIYEYFLTYKGSYSYSNFIGIDSGVSHMDDLLYLFNPHLDMVEFPTLRTDSDKAIRDIMVKMWTNFAKEGVPIPAGSLDFDWNPFPDSHQYLEIKIDSGKN